MGVLRVLYLVAAVALVGYVYRSTLKSLFRSGGPSLKVLARPLAVLAIAYVSGLNVPSIAETFSTVISPSITEPVFYLATLIAVVGVSFSPFLRPLQDDSNNSI